MSVQNFNKLRVLSMNLASQIETDCQSIEGYKKVRKSMVDFAAQQQTLMQGIFRDLLASRRDLSPTVLPIADDEVRLLLNNVTSLEHDYVEVINSFKDNDITNLAIESESPLWATSTRVEDSNNLSLEQIIDGLTASIENHVTGDTLSTALEAHIDQVKLTKSELIETHDRLRILFHNSAIAVTSAGNLKATLEETPIKQD